MPIGVSHGSPETLCALRVLVFHFARQAFSASTGRIRNHSSPHFSQSIVNGQDRGYSKPSNLRISFLLTPGSCLFGCQTLLGRPRSHYSPRGPTEVALALPKVRSGRFGIQRPLWGPRPAWYKNGRSPSCIALSPLSEFTLCADYPFILHLCPTLDAIHPLFSRHAVILLKEISCLQFAFSVTGG